MKNITTILLLIICSGCYNPPKDGKDTLKTIGDHDIYNYTWEGCEYLVLGNGYSQMMSHKGNCSSLIHRQIYHDTIFIEVFPLHSKIVTTPNSIKYQTGPAGPGGWNEQEQFDKIAVQTGFKNTCKSLKENYIDHWLRLSKDDSLYKIAERLLPVYNKIQKTQHLTIDIVAKFNDIFSEGTTIMAHRMMNYTLPNGMKVEYR